MGDNQSIIQLEEGWKNEILDKALVPLEKILNDGYENNTKLFSNHDYVNVYSCCYNMCTQRSPYNWSEQLYERHGKFFESYLRNSVLQSLTNQNGDQSGEFLLRELIRRGDNQKVMNKWMRNFFMYLDRYYVKYNQLPNLEESGNRKFKEIVFNVVKSNVSQCIINLINSERSGNLIDRDLIKAAVSIFVDMGMGSLETYNTDFEEAFLISSRDFYSYTAQTWVSEHSLPVYLSKAEQFMEEERTRVVTYLQGDTQLKLMEVFNEEILKRKQKDLLEKEGSGCKVMLVNDQFDDLSRLFRLFARVPESLPSIADMFKLHIIECGNDKIEQRLARLEKATAAPLPTPLTSVKDTGKEKDGEAISNTLSDDPQFIKDLLAVHDKYLKVTSEQFQGNASFQKALKDAFTDIVNRDAGKGKTPDLMGAFCDRLLKAGSGERLSDSEVEDYLEKCVQLFSYMNEKDLFAEIYRNLLSKRLLNQRSASDDMERLMISKLKLKCGAQFTAKMEGMLTDLTIGADHQANFNTFCRDNESRLGIGKIEFSVQVLTAGHWPTFKIIDVQLPVQLQRCYNVFKDYYEAKTSKRKLTWIMSLGTAHLKAMFSKKSYELVVSTLQAVVLMAFNVPVDNSSEGSMSFGDDNQGTRSFELLQSVTSINEEVLKRVLHSLACGKIKVIKRLTTTAAVGISSVSGAIKATDIFQFNETFSSPMRKIRIPMASLEDSHNPKKLEEDRGVVIEAAVVRIMKARKTLQHQQLVGEVLTQLAFFKPDPKVVKRRIEALIDREYLERDPDQPNVYRYLA